MFVWKSVQATFNEGWQCRWPEWPLKVILISIKGFRLTAFESYNTYYISSYHFHYSFVFVFIYLLVNKFALIWFWLASFLQKLRQTSSTIRPCITLLSQRMQSINTVHYLSGQRNGATMTNGMFVDSYSARPHRATYQCLMTYGHRSFSSSRCFSNICSIAASSLSTWYRLELCT